LEVDLPPILSSAALESNPPGRRLDVKKRFSEEQIIGFLREAECKHSNNPVLSDVI
jgi:hypothetical protein